MASFFEVREYIVRNYLDWTPGQPISDAQSDKATLFIESFRDVFDRGVSHGSYAYYIGDQIMEQAGITYHGRGAEADESQVSE